MTRELRAAVITYDEGAPGRSHGPKGSEQNLELVRGWPVEGRDRREKKERRERIEERERER